MNCSKIFLISIITITTIFCAEPPVTLLKTDSEIERQVDIWLQQYFSSNLYYNVGYTPELFNQIKKYLLENNYIQYMPHKYLKNIVKGQIIQLQKKKYRTERWSKKNRKKIISTIKEYLAINKYANIQNILEYLNTCKNKTCKNVQQAIKEPDFLPDLIKQFIKKIIKDVQY